MLIDRERVQCSELRTLLDSQGSQTSQIQEKIEFYKRRESELEARITILDAKVAQLNDDNAQRFYRLTKVINFAPRYSV